MAARRFSLSLAATAIAAVWVLTGCSSAAEPDTSATASASAPASTSESAMATAEAAIDQTVEEGCTAAATGLTEAIADLPSISSSLDAGDFATADASLKTVAARLGDVADEITNPEVNATFAAFVTEFTASGPGLEQMVANANDPAKIEELKAEFSTFGSGAATEAMGALCPMG